MLKQVIPLSDFDKEWHSYIFDQGDNVWDNA
jgi:hypothetical protein